MGIIEREWDEDYELLLRESLDSGDIATVSDGAEKRGSPRFRIQSGAIWVRLDTRFDVLNASISGISFQADRCFKAGEVLAITLAKAFKIEAEVIDCRMVETNPALIETAYITRCRFTDEHSAVRFLVMLKAVDNHEIELSDD